MKIYQIKRVRSVNGFTLLELMTVIAIISIMSVISIPNFISWYQSSKLNSATRDLMSDLALARTFAIKAYHPASIGVKVLFSANGYRIFVDEDNDNAIDAGEEVLRDKQYQAGVSMSAISFTGSRTIFKRSGAVSSAGSVTLRRGASQGQRVIVSLVGRIRVETV